MPITMAKRYNYANNSYTAIRHTNPARTRSDRGESRAAVSGFNAGAFRKAAAWVLGLCTVLLFFFGLSIGLIKAYQHIVTSDYFSITDISVTGNQYLSYDEIIDTSGIKIGDNIFTSNIHDIEQKLLNNPWIDAVSIKRMLPGTYNVKIEERYAKFWVLKEDAIYYLDSEGMLIAPVEGRNFQSLPMLDIGPGGEEALSIMPMFLEKISNTDLPFDLGQISWLRISAGKGFEMYWENKQLSLSIGIEDWDTNLQRIMLVINDMEKRNEISKVMEIRAADGQVWLLKV